jgi:hypothetical protein
MATHYVSIKVILDRLLRNSLLSGLSFESAIDYTIDFLGITGLPNLYVNKLNEGYISDYRGKLPCDFIREEQVLLSPLKGPESYHPARLATDTFHEQRRCIKNGDRMSAPADYTYSINNNFIFTSLENGLFKISYKAILTDDDGFPMLPSDPNFLLALE